MAPSCRLKRQGIRAGDRTYGHRVMGTAQAACRAGLRVLSQQLWNGPECWLIRRAGGRLFRSSFNSSVPRARVELNADESLLDQAVFTTEWPCAVLGSFKPEYLTRAGGNFDDVNERASGILLRAGQNTGEARAAFHRRGEQSAQRYVVDSSRKRACARCPVGRCQVFLR